MNRALTRSLLFLAFLAVVLWTVPAAAVSADRISVGSQAQVHGEDIYLREIAQIQAQPFATEMLGDLSLGRSPRPGKVKILTKAQVESGLRRHQDLIQGMTVEIPDRIFIKRTGQILSEQEIRLFVQETMDSRFKDMEVTLDRLEIPPVNELPEGQMGMAASEAPRIHSGGRFSMGLEIFVNGEKEDRVRISGQVSVMETVVAAVGKMERGRLLSPDAGMLVRKNIFSLKGEPVVRLDALSGMSLTRDVDTGEVLLADWLKPTPLVQKGDVVTLLAQRGGILIRTMGVSREDGVKNSLIEVENIRSGKVVRGLVREPSTVEVVY